MRGNPSLHHFKDASHQNRLSMAAIREIGVVDGVDETGVGPHLYDLTKHGEATEPGVKDENGRRRRHRTYESQTIPRVAIGQVLNKSTSRFATPPYIQEYRQSAVKGRTLAAPAPIV